MTQLYPYQKKGVRKIRHFGGRALVADEMGLGKSIQASTYAIEEKAFPILVVCPAFIKDNWADEFVKHFGMRSHIVSGRTVPKEDLRTSAKVVIINYDILPNWWKTLRKCGFQIVFFDEGQYLKNSHTQRTKAARKLCKKLAKILILTGSPIMSRPAEVWPLVNILRPDVFDSFFSFGARYCQPRFRFGKWEYKGAARIPELHALLNETCMIRRLKADVLKELPEKSRFVIPMRMTKSSEYREAVDDFLGWLGKVSPGKAKKAAKAEAVVKLGYLSRLAAELKLPNVLDWIANFLAESEEKLIVFGLTKRLLRMVQAKFPAQSCYIDGTVPTSDRKSIIKRFRLSSKKRLLICQTTTAVGWNAVEAATTAHIEMPWTPSDCDQADDRTHRIGQKRKTAHYYFVAKESTEEDRCNVLQKKRKIIAGVLDGKHTTKDADIYDQLIALLQRRKR